MSESTESSLRVVEFFSGIGGWRCALAASKVSFTIVEAFDINPAANTVYAANFGTSPSTKSIDGLTVRALEGMNAHMWVMSPPCQPFTRNNTTANRDMTDPRSKAFIRLLDILDSMQRPPQYLALENVVGFESSDCCRKLLDILRTRKYAIAQFVLTPLQFGVPNSRPRYYCIASRLQDDNSCFRGNSLPLLCAAYNHPSAHFLEITGASTAPAGNEKYGEELDSKDDEVGLSSIILYSLPTPQRYLSHLRHSNTSYAAHAPGVNDACRSGDGDSNVTVIPVSAIGNYLLDDVQYLSQEGEDMLKDLLVSVDTMQKSSSWCFDIVSPDSMHSACFTKAYGRYIKGTGSVILVSGDVPMPNTAVPPAFASTASTRPCHTEEGDDSDSRNSANDSGTVKEDIYAGESKSSAVRASATLPDDMIEDSMSASSSAMYTKEDTERQVKRCRIDRALGAGDKQSYDGDEQRQCEGEAGGTRAIAISCNDTYAGVVDTWAEKCKTLQLRYFSPRELLNIFGFPPAPEFDYPVGTISKRKMYELIGNSLNVVVAGALLKFLFGTGV